MEDGRGTWRTTEEEEEEEDLEDAKGHLEYDRR